MQAHLPNISCGHCKATIEREVGELPGVASVAVDVASRNATVAFEAPADWATIDALLAEIGYPVQDATRVA